ncbi:MAG: type II toxin-antitoxin system RelE/ParE family toxin [Chloroflexia bacterium]|nr:type II toxin-antitoxin system RelE/ParE family toxin [Chloroflexia bacterium]
MTPAAQRQFARLDVQLQGRLVSKLDDLANGAPNVDIEKLEGQGAYRLRVGSYRMVFQIDPEDQTIIVTKIGDCKDIYR